MIVDVEGFGSGFVPKASVMVREGYLGFLDLSSSPKEKERFISELWCSIRWESEHQSPRINVVD